MNLSPGLVGGLLVLSIVLSIGAIVAGVLAIQGERRVRATYSRFARGRREDVVTLLEMHMDEVQRLQQEVRRQQAYGKQLRALLARSLSRIGTVRYDAFDDMGGRLSFSIALLDEHGDGSVITAMNGRVQTRTYAKPIVGGTSGHNLSEEEVEAIAQAMENGQRRMAEATRGLPSAEDVDAAARPQPVAQPESLQQESLQQDRYEAPEREVPRHETDPFAPSPSKGDPFAPAPSEADR